MHKGKLKPKHPATEKLMNLIATHINFTKLQSIAKDVGMEDAKLAQVKAEFPGQDKYQVFEVNMLTNLIM